VVILIGEFIPFVGHAGQDPVRIMPLGDSITRGKMANTYRQYLRPMLIQTGINVDFVGSCPHAPDFQASWGDPVYKEVSRGLCGDLSHEGWGGLRIDQIINSTGNEFNYPHWTIEELIENNPADIILLMLGTNDILQNYAINGINDRYKELIERIFSASDGHVIVATLMPIFTQVDSIGSIRQTIRSFNKDLEFQISGWQEIGQPISILDTYPHFEEYDLLDGVHPNPQGNLKLAELWLMAINTYLNSSADSGKTQ